MAKKEPPSVKGYSDFALIGRGGSGDVFRARQNELDRLVAIKVLKRSDDRLRDAFNEERRILGRLSKHQNVVTVFDSGFTAEGEPYLAMEYCSRGSIASFVKNNGPLGVAQTVRVGMRVGEALNFIHEHDLVHCDVKPENVLVTSLGELMLADFGVAVILGSESTGSFSPHFVAPELLASGAPSPETDVYSLGSTLYYIHYGKAPHQSSRGERLTMAEILSRCLDRSFEISLPTDPQVPSQFYVLLSALMRKDPADRIRLDDALVILDALEKDLGTNGRKVELQPPELAGLPMDDMDDMDDDTVTANELRAAQVEGQDLDMQASIVGDTASDLATMNNAAIGELVELESLDALDGEDLVDFTKRVEPLMTFVEALIQNGTFGSYDEAVAEYASAQYRRELNENPAGPALHFLRAHVATLIRVASPYVSWLQSFEADQADEVRTAAEEIGGLADGNTPGEDLAVVVDVAEKLASATAGERQDRRLRFAQSLGWIGHSFDIAKGATGFEGASLIARQFGHGLPSGAAAVLGAFLAVLHTFRPKPK